MGPGPETRTKEAKREVSKDMRGFTILIAMAAASLGVQLAGAADTDYNGRWDLTIHKTPADHAWWLEISGAGTGKVKGMCTCTPDGLEAIQNARVENGVLRFSYDKPSVPGRAGRGP